MHLVGSGGLEIRLLAQLSPQVTYRASGQVLVLQTYPKDSMLYKIDKRNVTYRARKASWLWRPTITLRLRSRLLDVDELYTAGTRLLLLNR